MLKAFSVSTRMDLGFFCLNFNLFFSNFPTKRNYFGLGQGFKQLLLKFAIVLRLYKSRDLKKSVFGASDPV